MKRFRVTEQMLECVDDYSRRDSTVAEIRTGVRSFFPQLTKHEIDLVLEEWWKQMKEVS